MVNASSCTVVGRRLHGLGRIAKLTRTYLSEIDKCRSGEFADQCYSIKSLGSLICTCFKRLFAEG